MNFVRISFFFAIFTEALFQLLVAWIDTANVPLGRNEIDAVEVMLALWNIFADALVAYAAIARLRTLYLRVGIFPKIFNCVVCCSYVISVMSLFRS